MSFHTLISVSELASNLEEANWVVLDCRFQLTDPDWGRRVYLDGHIPGARFVHLDQDLSGPVIRGQTGRHPLPALDVQVERFGTWGIGPGVQVVAYDDAGGALAAVRAWWMLRALGHPAVAVLDGGMKSWIEAGQPVKRGVERRPARLFVPNPQPGLAVDAAQVDAVRLDSAWRLVDVRLPERFHGIVEPIDPVAGHIPGAINLPYTSNLGTGGKFLPASELRVMYMDFIKAIPAERTIFYCGSGVTSIHSILALLHAGLGEAKLYPGSWSEWITDPQRQVAR